MKKGFKAVGKAVVYFATYLLMQVIVSVVYSSVITTQMTMELMATGEEIDIMAMTMEVTEILMGRLMEMTFVAGLVTLVLFWLVFLIRRKKFKKEVCLRKFPANGILPIAVLAACFNVITSVIITYIPWPQSWMDSYAANSSSIDGSLMSWITAVLMAPVLEEIVFRGLMYTRLKKGLPVIAAAIVTSLAFGIAHGTMIWAIYTFIFSLVLIWVFEKFQSLGACIVLHMAYNLSGMALSLIPEEAAIVIWILFALGIVGAYFMYKVIVKITADIPRIEEEVPAIEAVAVEEAPVMEEVVAVEATEE